MGTLRHKGGTTWYCRGCNARGAARRIAANGLRFLGASLCGGGDGGRTGCSKGRAEEREARLARGGRSARGLQRPMVRIRLSTIRLFLKGRYMNLARIVIVVALAASSAHAADIAGEPVAPAHPCGHGEAWTCTVQCDPGMRTIPQALGAAMPGAQICAISSCACVATI